MNKACVITVILVSLTGILQATSGITGSVTDGLWHPIDGALIRVFVNPYGNSVAEEISDTVGIYTIDLSPGVYYAHCFRDGYIPMWWGDGFSPNDAVPISVDSTGGITTGIDFVLTAGYMEYGFIEGTVFDESTGERLDSAEVSFYLQGSYHSIASAHTDSNGYYIYSLFPTDVGYILKADKVGFASEWYCESGSQEDAQPVLVEGGETTPDIDFTLSPLVEPGSISGYVMGDDSIFIQATLYLYINYWGTPIEVQDTHQGYYTFGDLSSGHYFVFCDGDDYGERWWDEEINPEDADTIYVSSCEEVYGINFYFATLGGNRALAGWVYDKQTALGIDGACVTVYNISAPFDTAIGYTDFSGRYMISNVPEDTVIAVADAIGYIPEWYFGSGTFGGATPFIVPEGEVLDGINFELTADWDWSPGSISGRVTTQGGLPIENAWVSSYTEGGHLGGVSPVDSEGFYTIDSLESGYYYVVSRAQGFYEEWYLESPDPDGATEVEVQDGEGQNGIDFSLEPVEIGFITGEVQDTDSVGIAEAVIWAEGVDNWYWGYTATDATGDYLLELQRGFYTVSVYAEGYQLGFYAEPVEVIANQITPGVNLFLPVCSPEDGVISGSVVEDFTGNPIEDAIVLLFSDCIDTQYFGYALTDEAGQYSIENIPVIYCLCYYLVAFAPGYISEFYEDAYTYENATPLGSFADEADFSLCRAMGGPMGISGRVLSGRNGVGDALIYAVSNGKKYASARSRPDGSYRISGLPPDVYTVVFTAVRYGTEYYPYPVDVTSDNVSGVNADLSGMYGVEDDNEQPRDMSLKISPSPARIDPIIQFVLSAECKIHMTLYDVTGRVVEEIASGHRDAGLHTEILGTEGLREGVYFLRLQAGEYSVTKKVVILR